MMETLLTVGFDDDAQKELAQSLASQLGLQLDSTRLPRLHVTDGRIELLVKGFSPLFVDFNTDALRKRRDAGKAQGLVRACKPALGVNIIDATGGWGQDAVILASLGANVLLLERHPVMAALLQNGLERLEQDHLFFHRLALKYTNAIEFLYNLPDSQYPDVIYVDPMHPVRQKSALVKKKMQALQQMIGSDRDALELIRIAQKRARSRVVVKWPAREAPLITPAMAIKGKTVRFDVYFPNQ